MTTSLSISCPGTVRIDLLGIAASIAGAIAAWMQVEQHQTQARSYFIVAQELAAIRAISREHVLWRASRSS